MRKRRRKQIERDNVRAQRDAEDAQRKQEAKQARIAGRVAQVDAMNVQLAAQYDYIDTLLAATLDVGDYVDLPALIVEQVTHPPFDQGVIPGHPGELVYPPEPTYVEPVAPTGWFGKKQHEAAVHTARLQFESDTLQWRYTCRGMYDAHLAAISAWPHGQSDPAAHRVAYERETCRSLVSPGHVNVPPV